MDFLDPRKKRAHRIQLYIGYFLMTIAIALATTLLVFIAEGFDVNRKTGSIIRNGLIFLDSHPVSAKVFLNGEEKGETDGRFVVPSGQYEVALRQEGYREWKRNFYLEGGRIERLVYPVLFPTQLVSRDVRQYDAAPGLVTSSPDRRWILLQVPASLNRFDVVDLNSSTNSTATIVVPSEVFTAAEGEHKLELAEWSTDNRRVLVKHTYGSATEYVVIDREVPTESFNVNRLFEMNPALVTLRDKKADQFYLLEANGTLRRADSRTKQMTAVLSNVVTFKPHGQDVILFVTRDGASSGKVRLKVRNDAVAYTLRELPGNASYLVDLARYDDKWYMAGGAASEQKVYIYKEAFAKLEGSATQIPAPDSVLKIDVPSEALSFSATAQFIALQGSGKFAVYDAEADRQYRYDSGLVLTPGQRAEWMDGNRLGVVSQNKVTIFDYDGINMQSLVDANPSYKLIFDRDYRVMYTLSPSRADATKQALVRTEMRVLAR